MVSKIRVWRPWQLFVALVVAGWYNAALWRIAVHGVSASANLSPAAGWAIRCFLLSLEVPFALYFYASSMLVTVTDTSIRISWLFGIVCRYYDRSMVAKVHENHFGDIRIGFFDGRRVLIGRWSLGVQRLRQVLMRASVGESIRTGRLGPVAVICPSDIAPLLPLELKWPRWFVWLALATLTLLFSVFVYELLVLVLRLEGGGDLSIDAIGRLAFLALGAVYWALVAFLVLRKYTTVLRLDRDAVLLFRFFGIVKRSWSLADLKAIVHASRVPEGRGRGGLSRRGAAAKHDSGIVVLMRTGEVFRFEYEGGAVKSILLMLESIASTKLNGES